MEGGGWRVDEGGFEEEKRRWDREASLLELDRVVIKRFAIDCLPMGQPVPEQGLRIGGRGGMS